MNIKDAIWQRRSIRGFTSQPVEKEIIRTILEMSVRAPSAHNCQPWGITVVTGKALDIIRKENCRLVAEGFKPRPEFTRVPAEGKFRERQVEVGIQLFKTMGIEREDKEKRAAWSQRGYRFFDAPVALLLTIEKSQSLELSCMAVGSLVQNICLIAMEYGLGTCVASQGIWYPDIIRTYVPVPESQRIITSISMGYPDPEFPANAVQSSRAELDEVTLWVE